MDTQSGRIILHCDLNSFFASVELLSRPELRDVPVAVCGDPASRHGVILAKNEPAKKCGIITAETIWQAKKKCPNLVLLPPHHQLYLQYSQQVNRIYERYTDLVEPFSIDESWLDITGSAHLFGSDPKEIADDIRARVHAELGLTLSVGVSFNKIFAKLGSDYKKPDATTVISRQNWREIVWPLPTGALLFVGGTSQTLLARYGIHTIGELASCKPQMLQTLMGKNGVQLWEYANGMERGAVRSGRDREPSKSVGNGTTFPEDLTRREQVKAGVSMLSDSVAMRLRTGGMYAGGVQITLRTPDFKTITRQKQLPAPTHLMRDLVQASMELLESAWKPPTPIRMLTVTAISLVPSDDAFEQVSLFNEAGAFNQKRQEKIEETMDSIRKKFGADAIQFGNAREKKEDPLP